MKLKSMQKGIVKCRICKEDHWTTQCPYKDTLLPVQEALKVNQTLDFWLFYSSNIECFRLRKRKLALFLEQLQVLKLKVVKREVMWHQHFVEEVKLDQREKLWLPVDEVSATLPLIYPLNVIHSNLLVVSFHLTADEGCTVRVTNLSENARDSDLQELFGRIGDISRIFLSKVCFLSFVNVEWFFINIILL